MKKFTFIIVLFAVGFLTALGQLPQGHPDNLNWTPPSDPQSGLRVDPGVFLQGNYVELGIHPAGSGGIYGPVPAGYHPMLAGLGFVADHDKDGWLVGVPPQTGDYFLPGYPWEGWLVEYTYLGNDYTFINCGECGQFGVPQTSLTNTSAGSTRSAVWTGTATGGGQSLLVNQHFYFDENDGRFFIHVTLTNAGPNILQNVEYARAVDPDQEQNITGNFATRNFVSHQPNAGNGYLAEVQSFGLLYDLPMALQLWHPNAKAHVVQFALDISTPNEPLDFTFAPTEAAPYIADVGVAVAVRFPLLNPGQSESFYVIYVLNTEDILNPPPPPGVPLSNWALYLMIGLIVIFTVIRFRRMA